jgi:hypothetical protein
VLVGALTRDLAAANVAAVPSGLLGFFAVGIAVDWHQDSTGPGSDLGIMRLIAEGALTWSGLDGRPIFHLYTDDPVRARRYRSKSRLEHLVKRGWVEPFRVDADGGPRFAPVRLTPAGYGVVRVPAKEYQRGLRADRGEANL